MLIEPRGVRTVDTGLIHATSAAVVPGLDAVWIVGAAPRAAGDVSLWSLPLRGGRTTAVLIARLRPGDRLLDVARGTRETAALLARPDSLGEDVSRELVRWVVSDRVADAERNAMHLDPFADPLGYGLGRAVFAPDSSSTVVYSVRETLRAGEIDRAQLRNLRSVIGALPGGGAIVAAGERQTQDRWIALATGHAEQAGSHTDTDVALRARQPWPARRTWHLYNGNTRRSVGAQRTSGGRVERRPRRVRLWSRRSRWLARMDDCADRLQHTSATSRRHWIATMMLMSSPRARVSTLLLLGLLCVPPKCVFAQGRTPLCVPVRSTRLFHGRTTAGASVVWTVGALAARDAGAARILLAVRDPDGTFAGNANGPAARVTRGTILFRRGADLRAVSDPEFLADPSVAGQSDASALVSASLASGVLLLANLGSDLYATLVSHPAARSPEWRRVATAPESRMVAFPRRFEWMGNSVADGSRRGGTRGHAGRCRGGASFRCRWLRRGNPHSVGPASRRANATSDRTWPDRSARAFRGRARTASRPGNRCW